MKRKALLITLLMIAAILVFAACSGKAESISVKTPPTKTEYFVGEELSLEGGVIEVTYPDKTKDVKMTSSLVKVEGFKSDTVGLVSLTVKYLNLTANFDITVVSHIKSISVKTPPQKEVYYVGDELDLTGGMLLIVFVDGKREEIAMSNSAITKTYDFSRAGDAEVVLNYKGFETSFTVFVKEDVIESVKVLSYPEKTEYKVGEEVDLEGGVVEFTYESGLVRVIEMTDEQAAAVYSFANLGGTIVTVGLLGYEFTYQVNVSEADEILRIVNIYHMIMTEGIGAGMLIGDNGPYFAYEKLYVDLVKAVFASENQDIINRLYIVTVYDDETIMDWFEMFAEEHNYLLDEFIAPFGEDYLVFFVDYLTIMANWLEAGASVIYGTKVDRELYPEFDNDMERLAAEFHALTPDVQLEFFVTFNLLQIFGEMNDRHYQYVLTSEEYDAYFKLFEAKVVYIMYMTGNVTTLEFITYMDLCVEAYESLGSKANFSNYFCGTEYAYYKEALMVALIDRIEELVVMAFDTYYYYEDFWFYYAYVQLKETISNVYDKDDQKYIAEYEEEYKDGFEIISELYYGTIHRNGFDDEDFVAFISIFFDMAYNYENDETYVESEGFYADYDVMIALFNVLSDENKAYFSRIAAETYHYYFYLTVGYYSQYFINSEIQVLKHYLNAYIMYVNYVYDGSRIESFVENMELCVAAYNALSDTSYFDFYFSEQYAEMLELYNLAIQSELQEIYNVIGEVSNGLIYIMYYGDYTYFLHYYPKMIAMVENLLDSGNADLINGFNTVLFDGYPLSDYYAECLSYGMYYDMAISAVVGSKFEEFFYAYMEVAGKWIEAGGVITETCDRSIYADFDNEMDELNAMFMEIEPKDLYDFLDLCDVFFMLISVDHYKHVLSTAEYNVFYNLYYARQNYILYLAGKDSVSSFTSTMAKAVTGYENLIDKDNFNKYLGSVYIYYFNIYDAIINPESVSGQFSIQEAILEYGKRAICA